MAQNVCKSQFWCEITPSISFFVKCLISRATLRMDFFVLNHARDRRRESIWPRTDHQSNFKIIFHLFSSFVYAKPKQPQWKFETFGGATFTEKSRCLQSCDTMQFTWNKLKVLDLRAPKSPNSRTKVVTYMNEKTAPFAVSTKFASTKLCIS